MRLIHILCSLSFFLLFACGEEKEFMTPKPGEIVLDVNVDDYSLNGIVLGKTGMDILSVNDLLITSLYNEIQKIRQTQNNVVQKVKFHVDEKLSFSAFYKVVATFGFNGFSSVQYVIGSNYEDEYELILPKRILNDTCNQFNSTKHMLDLISGKASRDELLEQRVKAKECQIERAKKYVDLSLSVESNGNNWVYMVRLNETGLTDGNKLYQFEKDTDVWKFIEDVRLRRSLSDKEDRDKILLALRKNVLLKDIAPIIKKLTSYGYKISFAQIGG